MRVSIARIILGLYIAIPTVLGCYFAYKAHLIPQLFGTFVVAGALAWALENIE